MALKSVNPYTNEILQKFDEISDKKVNELLENSVDAFKEWKNTTFDYRKNILLEVARLLHEQANTLGETITKEMGKPITESKAEIEKCAWVCKHYAENASVMLHREAIPAGTHLSFISYEPLGTILGIMPWNFPFWQVFRFLAPTLMAGNTVLLKHASNVQMCAQAIEELVKKAGLPEGVFSNLVIRSDKVEQIIKHPAVKAVTLTGSEAAGASVASTAGANIKKSVLELGGSNAFIVLEGADINKAAEIGAQARLQNGGQSCIAAKRFIVHEKIAGEFIEKFSDEMSKYKTGDPMDEKTNLGPLASIGQAETVKKQLDKSVEMGAEIILGGTTEKAFFHSTLVKNVKPGMPLFDEEVFGPVAPVILVKDDEEAIELSNNSSFGLGVSMFTDDLEKAEKLVPEFQDGAVFVNALVKSDPRLPFGGTKKSGYGRELSVNGIREFVNIKTVYIEKFRDFDEDENGTSISMGSPE